MSSIVQNLRGTLNEWNETNPVIPDGAVAVLKHDDRHYDIKIGNGELSFSELPYLGSRVVNPSMPSHRLQRGESARFGKVGLLTLAYTKPPEEDFYASASFDSPENATVFELLGSAKFSGTDCEEGMFSPQPCMHYSLFFWYDGIMNCIVRGVKND